MDQVKGDQDKELKLWLP